MGRIVGAYGTGTMARDLPLKVLHKNCPGKCHEFLGGVIAKPTLLCQDLNLTGQLLAIITFTT